MQRARMRRIRYEIGAGCVSRLVRVGDSGQSLHCSSREGVQRPGRRFAGDGAQTGKPPAQATTELTVQPRVSSVVQRRRCVTRRRTEIIKLRGKQA